MTSQERKNIIVLGAGPTGLLTAWGLTRQGHRVTLLEKSPFLGGLCHTLRDQGYHLDLGPHVIHTQKTDIINFFKEALGPDLIPNIFKVKIYFNRKFVDYPLKGLNALKILTWKLKITAVFDFLLARLCMLFRKPKDTSFKDWITNRFGKTLYSIYFGPYAQKAWKIPPEEISFYVAEQRVPIISVVDYIRKLFRVKPKQAHKESGPTVQSFYPRFGIGQVIDHFADQLEKANCTILQECNITSLQLEDHSLKRVYFEHEGIRHALEADFVISTIPIDNLIKLFHPLPPAKVMEAARNISYCSERFFYIKLNQEKACDVPLLYFQDPKIKFNRVYDVRLFSQSCVPRGKNALCFEFTCSTGDEIWNAAEDELYAYIADILRKESILDIEGRVEGYFSTKITHAYPRFRVGFQEHLHSIFSFLSGLDNIMTLGRQGLFSYANIDEVVSMVLRVLEHLNTSQDKTIEYHSLFQEYLHYE